MWDLRKHEQLEMEILESLNSVKMLGNLIFCGGTMLRLCHELARYSVDLDFWCTDKSKEEDIYQGIKEFLKNKYDLKRSKKSEGAIVFEFSAKGYPRSLKIEIRHKDGEIQSEEKIAFSQHSTIQVLTRAATLDEMMGSKIETFFNRLQIRDVYDIEFLSKKGISINAGEKDLVLLKKMIKKFKANDYRISLGALLEFNERQYYKTANFRLLLEKIDVKLEEAKKAKEKK